jgi:hypothetical protein
VGPGGSAWCGRRSEPWKRCGRSKEAQWWRSRRGRWVRWTRQAERAPGTRIAAGGPDPRHRGARGGARGHPVSRVASSSWAIPKSVTLAVPSGAISTFPGLMSRWTIPAEWMWSSAPSSSRASRLRSRSRGPSGNPARESLALDVLHDQIGTLALAAEVVDTDQVGVRESGGEPGLAAKPGQVGVVGGEGVGEEFHRHLPAEPLVVRKPDRRHAAGAEEPLEPVALAEQRPFTGTGSHHQPRRSSRCLLAACNALRRPRAPTTANRSMNHLRTPAPYSRSPAASRASAWLSQSRAARGAFPSRPCSGSDRRRRPACPTRRSSSRPPGPRAAEET